VDAVYKALYGYTYARQGALGGAIAIRKRLQFLANGVYKLCFGQGKGVEVDPLLVGDVAFEISQYQSQFVDGQFRSEYV
jgi:hypothetical protein